MSESNDDFDQENDDDGQGSNDASNPINTLRKQNRDLTKQLKVAQTQVTEFEAYKAERAREEKVAKASTIFEGMGLNPSQAKLFTALNGEADPTAEAVAKFVLDYDLGVPADQVADLEVVAEGPKFVPLSPGSAVPVRTMLSRDQFTALKRTDMVAAAKAVEEGRVEGFTAKLVPVDGGGWAAETTRGG